MKIESGKELKADQENIAVENTRTPESLEETARDLPLPEQLPEDQAGKATKFPLQSPFYFSQELLDSADDIPSPTPIESTDGLDEKSP